MAASRRVVRTLLIAALAGAVRPVAAQQPAANASTTFTVGTATASRAGHADGFIQVPAGVDAALEIPVAVFHGARPGPVLALVAGAHGTEYASIIAMERLIATLDPAKLRGTVIVVPLVNVPSFAQKVAHLNPVDGKNMNRHYPGRPDGTQTERAAHALTKQVVEPADFLIDMHGGDVDEALRPFVYWTPSGNATQDSASKAMVLAFGLDHIVVSRDRPKVLAEARYLENTAVVLGKVAFTAEAGGHGTVRPADVDTLVAGTLGVMRQLGMLDGPRSVVRRPIWLTEMHTVTGDSSGIFHPAVQPDQRVARNALLGRTTDLHGREIEVVRSPVDGIVLYVRPVPSMTRGETIAGIGVVGTP